MSTMQENNITFQHLLAPFNTCDAYPAEKHGVHTGSALAVTRKCADWNLRPHRPFMLILSGCDAL